MRPQRALKPAKYRKAHRKLRYVRARMEVARLRAEYEAEPWWSRLGGFEAWLERRALMDWVSKAVQAMVFVEQRERFLRNAW